MASSVGEIALDLILNSEEFESKVSEIAKKTAKATGENSSFADSLGKVGSATSTVGTALVGLSAPITGIGIASTKSALTFEDSMAKVMTIADQTEVSYDDMKSAIMDLSTQTGISANEIADNVYNAISAGQSTGDAVNFVEKSTKLARAGFADAGSALDILTTIMNAYGMEAKEVTNVSDMLIQTQNKGKVTVGELSSAMGKVIPTAKANSVSLDQICSGYAIMTANGVACAESTTYMNSMLNELGKSGTTVSDCLKEQTGKSFSELMASGKSLGDVLKIVDDSAKKSGLAFTDMWGSAEAGKAGLILLGNSGKEFNAMLGDMQASTGATDKAFETLDTTSYDMEKALNEVKNTAIQLGGTLLETLAPVIQKVCDGISKACEWFNSLDDSTKKTIFAIGGVVTVIGTGLVVFGKLATGISSVITAVKTIGTAFSALGGIFTAFNPVVLIVVAVIGALIAIGVLLYKNWDTIKEKLSQFAEYWKAGWNAIKEFFINVWEGIKSFLAQAWEVIKAIFSTALTVIKSYWTMVWENIKTFFVTIFNTIKTFITGWFEMVKTQILTWLTLVKTYFMTIFNSIKIVIQNVFNTIKTIIQTVFNAIKTIITTVLNGIKTFISNIFNAIKCLIKGDVEGAKQSVGRAFQAMKDTVSKVLGAIKSCVSNVFGAIKNGISNTISGIKTTVVNGFNTAFNAIKEIPKKAVQWGKDMIMGIVKGIKDTIGNVKDAVGGVANKISSYLHFSCPDEGPLSDYESWMPDFMQGLAKGIKGNSGLVTDAISDLGSTMQLGLETPELRNTSNNQQATNNNSEMFGRLFEMFSGALENQNNGDIIIPVYVGGNAIDEIVVKAQDRRKLRSGGMA